MDDTRHNDIKNMKSEDQGNIPCSSIEPSFKGRLNLAEYAFSSTSESKSKSLSPHRVPQASNSSSLGTESTTKRKLRGKPSPLPSPQRKKARSSPSTYAPPSTYAHLPELQDVLTSNLICVFVGLNPGIQTATQGHAYAHPSNRFWKLLHSSGLTTCLCRPDEDGSLPARFALGNTNIVSRPTRNGAELSKKEMDDSVHVVEGKIRKFRPEAVAFVGKSIWESVWRVRHGRRIKKEEFKYGWQDEDERLGAIDGGEGEEEWKGARVFVATSTSGLAATLPYTEKERIWRELGVWVEQKRVERSAAEVSDVISA